MHLLNTNYADLSLLFAQDAGRRDAMRIWDAKPSPSSTRRRARRIALNLHVEDVGHTLVLGATGSGKSFLLNFLIAHLQRYSPRTLIFDLGGSYDGLTSYFGGQALRVALDRPGFTINPFCLEPTPTNLQFLFTFVQVLLQAGGQYTMTRADDQALYEQLETLYALDPDQRRLFTLANILPRGLAQHLQRWVQGGQYARRLRPRRGHGHAGAVSVRRLRRPRRRAAGAGAAALLPPASRDGDDPRSPRWPAPSKCSCWTKRGASCAIATIRAYVTEALKTWRKKNACVLMATQSSEDLERSELLRVAIESCPTKFFLANPQIDQAVYQDLFHLNETEAGAHRDARPAPAAPPEAAPRGEGAQPPRGSQERGALRVRAATAARPDVSSR